MGSPELDRLAAVLGRPVSSLSALASLTPAQIAMLTEAIEARCDDRRRVLDDALRRTLPGLSSRASAGVLRARRR